jgi:hypothetical protein
MSKYCQCPVCKNSPAQPKAGTAGGDAEIVEGPLWQLTGEQKLVHWSDRTFSRMLSTELAQINLRGVNPVAVSASFYLYREGSKVPATIPKQLVQMGLGGKNRYIIDAGVSGSPSIYIKAPVVSGDAAEVVVVLGCGGYIDFNGEKKATVVNRIESPV